MNTQKKVEVSKTLKSELDKLPTTSSKIRYLDSKDYSRGDISRILNIRYQHVRNVLITPVKNPVK